MPSSKKKPRSEQRIYIGLGALVVGLAALVWWSLPSGGPPAVSDREPEASGDGGDEELLSVVPRPPQASAELAVIVDISEDAAKKLASVAEIEKRLAPRHCGTGCDAVRKLMADEDGFEVHVSSTEDLILPSKETLDTVAPGLTAEERATVHKRPTSIVVRTTGPFSREQVPARAVFAAAAALAEAANGLVYDETSRRIETAAEVLRHTVTAPLGEPAFAPRHIVVQMYRQEDGTARLLTLGMARFASPDLSLRGANMSAAPLLAEVLNAAARRIVDGHQDGSLTLTTADIAAVMGKKARELGGDAPDDRPVKFDLAEPSRTEGDPDNEMAELVPPGGASRESWDAVVASLFGHVTSVTDVDDKELSAIAESARKDFPRAVARWQAGAGDLYVKGPFAIPPDQRADGGPAFEHLWIHAAACDARACTGTLSNEPSYLTNLAAGKTTSIARAEVVDFLLQARDGGTLGGESIKLLRARRPR
jgi:uncharacterized protein YegJ (DUF2314 family)